VKTNKLEAMRRGCLMSNSETSYEIRKIDLSVLVQNHGINFKKSGSRYIGLCPFHSEKTPSFVVFPNNSYYCFGCGSGGDAATFIMKYYGCTFPEALNRLGIRKTGQRYTSTESKAMQENRKKRDLVSAFRTWERHYSSILGRLIVSAHRRLNQIRNEVDLQNRGWIYHFLPKWKHHLDILCYGTDQDKYLLFKEVR
jgi:hypothetical protein